MNKEIEIVKLMENKQQHRKSRKHMEKVETSLYICFFAYRGSREESHRNRDSTGS
jgi:hypothetical protein